MDYKLLVDEIIARVEAKLADQVGEASATNKKQTLILTEQHGTTCHELLENSILQTCCHIDCALLKEYDCDLENYGTVVIYHLSNNALSKLAGGVADTPFISLASKAILMGKKVLVLKDNIELYQYELTAPSAYYAMMSEKLRMLKASGVIFCEQSELENMITDSCTNQICSQKELSAPKECIDIKIDKKVITESDIKKLIGDGVNGICINSNSILTDLAKEYLHNRKIEVKREPSTSRKLGLNR